MVFGKKTHLIGLDIGSNTLKVAEIKETKNGLSLSKFGMVDIEPGLIRDGSIKSPEIVADSIRQLLRAHNIKEHNIAISIGGYSVIVKNITVKSMGEEELQETIHLEAEQYIPFDINDVNLDFQILGENEYNPGQMSVLLVAAKKEIIDDYLNLVQIVGLNPCIIDVDVFALQNIFEINYDSKNENVALIDIGASKTSFNILKENFSVFMRDVSLGCGQINQKIVSLIGCSPGEAEQLKHIDRTDKISEADLMEIISSVVTGWSSEIGRALDFFYSTYPSDQINRIILSGGGANIEKFRQLLAEETSCKVEIIDPFKNIVVDDFDSSYLKQIASQAAICMGLAIRRVDDK